MSEQHLIERDREMIPTRLLWAMLALVLACLGVVTIASLTDRPLEAMPPNLPVVQEREIVIRAEMSGAALIEDKTGSIIADLGPTEGGFIAGVGRVLHRERTKHGLDPALPVRLIQYSDGRLALRDDHTSWRAEIRGFGQTNEAAFYSLLNN